MENIFGSTHFNTIAVWLKQRFGCRVMKLSLDGGFTCPNRDGSKGTGGCLFCSEDGSGHYASTIPAQIQLLSGKWPQGKYIAYFQSYTNTYAEPEVLRRLFDDALAWPGVVGLAVATRPDCLPPAILDLLSEYNRKTFLWIELGLQTIHETTARQMNRCYPLSDFDQAMKDLAERRILTVVHLILGLPGETREMMRQSVQYVCALRPFGMKLHLLHVLKNTGLAKLYPQGIDTFTQQEYIEFVVDLLEQIPQDITIHRLTGDGPAEDLISPLWSVKKRDILNGIQKEFKRRDSWQGKLL